jgi:phage shock protein E
MNIFQSLFSKGEAIDLQSLIDQGAFLVDVRTAAEFSGGHVKGSVNIPLNNIPTQLANSKTRKTLLCFAEVGEGVPRPKQSWNKMDLPMS